MATNPHSIEHVVVHPLVLLSVVDHFNRMSKIGNKKRVVGVLLGSNRKGTLDVTNSFAVPFDEEEKGRDVWYLDHDYLEKMYAMFKKVNARERVVGWYHTGPLLQPNDIQINDLLRKYCPNSVLVIIDAKPKELGLPTAAYVMTEVVPDDGTVPSPTFKHVESSIEAEEAEEVGVEHLLRDIKDTTVGTLSQQITSQLLGIKGLVSQLQGVHAYLEKVVAGQYQINHPIIYQFQDIVNLLPDVLLEDFVKTMFIKTNDQMLVVYLASLIRSIIALHSLINNKLHNRDVEKNETKSSGDFKKMATDATTSGGSGTAAAGGSEKGKAAGDSDKGGATGGKN